MTRVAILTIATISAAGCGECESSGPEIPFDEIDNDCDPDTLDDDGDQDGVRASEDCDDTNAAVNVTLDEVPYDGLDNDCDPRTPDDDLDADGAPLDEDCDDLDPDVGPHAEEIPNDGIDNDCDPSTLDQDGDRDGVAFGDDCDDDNPAISDEYGTVGDVVSSSDPVSICDQWCGVIVDNDVVMASSTDTDLSWMHCVEAISGRLVIDANPALTSLDGADALQSVGVLEVSGNGGLVDGTGLGDVTVTEGVDVAFNPVLTSLAFGSDADLQEIAIVFNEQLTSLAPLPDLERLDGSLLLWSAALVTVDQLPAVTRIGGDIHLSGLPVEDIRFPSLVEVGVIDPEACGALTVLDFPRLETLERLDIWGSPVENVDGFGSLHTAGSIMFYDTSLADVDGFANLQTAERFEITLPAPQTDLSGLDNLTSLYRLDLSLTEWTSIEGLDGLVHADIVSITNNHYLTTIDGLSSLRTIGWLEASNNSVLADLGPLPALQSIDDLNIDNSPLLADLGDFAGVDVTRSLQLRGLTLIPDLVGPRFGSTMAEITLQDNDHMVSLDGLDSVRSVTGDLRLLLNDRLQSVSALEGVGSVDGSLQILWNPLLGDATAQALVDTIGVDNIGSVTISGNEPVR